jgi:uncharacterized membrane protein YeaQ/YmgE (transglycosylase-associated protein family)
MPLQHRKEDRMGFLIWPMIGILIAVLIGVGPRRRAFHPNANASFLAGAFGALVGGIIGDGLPPGRAGAINLTSIIGAVIGALLFCWAVHDRASDIES